MKISQICSYVIEFSFYALFFFVPIIWLPVNSELFEFNKFIVLLSLTSIITTAWVVKMLSDRQFKFKRTPLDLAILVFLGANILATVFSIDPYTSVMGYYGRWNAGLLSIFAYLILYYALVNNSSKRQIYYFLATLFTSGLIISIYAILQHPNPLFREQVGGKTIFHGIDYNYWAVDVENRVFSTLGQPNWLAAYLAMLILPLLSLLFIFKKLWQTLLILVSFAAYYLAFTFTFSRGGLVGLLLGVASFVIILPFYQANLVEKIKKKIPLVDLSVTVSRLQEFIIAILGVVLIVVLTNQFFGNALTLRGGLADKQATTSQTSTEKPVQTQLEVAGSQTAQIRTIVWTGSLAIFKAYPLFGSGLETFGYSYYLFRPAEHNYTSEWDFLYNKAHNEFVNYLATTGAVGLLAYLLYIGSFEFFAIRRLVKMPWSNERFLGIGLWAGFNTSLGANFFGFSVVPTNLLFYTFPAMFFLITNTLADKNYALHFPKLLQKSLYNNIAKILIMLLGIFLLLSTLGYWVGDYFYNQSFGAKSYQKAISYLRISTAVAAYEPTFKSELASNLASLAGTLNEDDGNSAEVLESEAEARKLINNLTKAHPNNTALWQDKRRIDYTLSKINPAENAELIKTIERLQTLAPTDANIQYNLALNYLYMDKNAHAAKLLEKVVSLKSDYREAVLLLARTYSKTKDTAKALKLLNSWLELHPDDSEAKDLLTKISTS